MAQRYWQIPTPPKKRLDAYRPVLRGMDKKNADNIEVPAKDNNITGDISTLIPAYGIKSTKSDDFYLIYIRDDIFPRG